MKKNVINILSATTGVFFCLISVQTHAQENFNMDTLYIKGSNDGISSDDLGQLYYTMIFKSKDSISTTDAYKFIIPNQIGFENYSSLKQCKKKVSPKTYKTTNELRLWDRWRLHQYLSYKTTIYLITQPAGNEPKENEILDAYKIVYNGTQKNLELLKF